MARTGWKGSVTDGQEEGLTDDFQITCRNDEDDSSLFSLPPVRVGLVNNDQLVAFGERKLFFSRTGVRVQRTSFHSYSLVSAQRRYSALTFNLLNIVVWEPPPSSAVNDETVPPRT